MSNKIELLVTVEKNTVGTYFAELTRHLLACPYDTPREAIDALRDQLQEAMDDCEFLLELLQMIGEE